MIVDALLDIVQGLLEFIGDLIPNFSAPGWLVNGVSDVMTAAAAKAAPLSGWVPFGVLGAVVGTITALWLSLGLFRGIVKIYAMVRGGAS